MDGGAGRDLTPIIAKSNALRKDYRAACNSRVVRASVAWMPSRSRRRAPIVEAEIFSERHVANLTSLISSAENDGRIDTASNLEKASSAAAALPALIVIQKSSERAVGPEWPGPAQHSSDRPQRSRYDNDPVRCGRSESLSRRRTEAAPEPRLT